ncbi:MAG: ECF-type sigma factor [Acidobacteriota bacterium]
MRETHQDEATHLATDMDETQEPSGEIGEEPIGRAGGEVTALLQRWAEGDRRALDQLMPRLVGELKALARQQMYDAPDDVTLHPTAMVNEAYLRLVGVPLSGFAGRGQFFALAARVLRSVLVDHLRSRSSAKRGGDAVRLPLDWARAVPEPATLDIAAVLTLHDALHRLEEVDSRRGQVVELRYFGGLTLPEIAEALEVSLPTVERDWRVARRWLARELARDLGSAAGR